MRNKWPYFARIMTTTKRFHDYEIFRDAVSENAASIIVVHNHPSGDPSPSPEDVAVTRAMIDAGRLLDIEVLDHLVIGTGRFVSLKSKGLGFDPDSSVSAL